MTDTEATAQHKPLMRRLKPVLEAVGSMVLLSLVLGSVGTFFDTGPGHAWVQDFHVGVQHFRDHPDELRIAVKRLFDGVGRHGFEIVIIAVLWNLSADVHALVQRFDDARRRDHD